MKGGPPRPRPRVEEWTADWVRERLEGREPRLLEVGCGEGVLAALLAARGIRVEAVDSDPSAVLAARERGVDARVGEWPALDAASLAAGDYDAVLFRRSLHHLEGMADAVEGAARLLAGDGIVLVEEFDRFGLTPVAGAWLAGQVGILAAARLLDPEPDSLAGALLGGTDPGEAWRERYDPDFPGIEEIREALRSRLEIEVERTPLLFREVAGVVPDSDRGEAVIEALREAEIRLIGAGVIPPLGRRFVGRPRDR